MSISTYADLQSAVATWLIRTDQAANIPNFIALAETRLNRVLRQRQAEMDIALTAVPASRFIALPSLYSEGLNAWIIPPGGSERLALRFVDPAAMVVSSIVGMPLAWSIDGANLTFERPADQAYAIVLRGIEKYILSDANPTNSLLSDYPDAYLFATLAEAGAMLRDADLTNAYEAKLTRTIAEINAKDARSRAQQTLSTEPGVLTFAGRRSGYNINADRFG